MVYKSLSLYICGNSVKNEKIIYVVFYKLDVSGKEPRYNLKIKEEHVT